MQMHAYEHQLLANKHQLLAHKHQHAATDDNACRLLRGRYLKRMPRCHSTIHSMCSRGRNQVLSALTCCVAGRRSSTRHRCTQPLVEQNSKQWS